MLRQIKLSLKVFLVELWRCGNRGIRKKGNRGIWGIGVMCILKFGNPTIQ